MHNKKILRYKPSGLRKLRHHKKEYCEACKLEICTVGCLSQ